MKSILIISSLAIVLALPLTALAGSEAVKESGLELFSGQFETDATMLANCTGDLEECNESLSNINSLKEDCESKLSAIEYKPTKPKPKPKKPKGDKQICKSSKYNGMWSHYGWDLSFCDVEAALDGYCLTVKDLHKVDKCLDERLGDIEDLDLESLIERVEELEKMEKISVMDGNYVTPKQLQEMVNLLMAHIEALRVVVDELAPKVSKLREDVDALTLRVDAIEDELAKLKELVLRLDACIHPEAKESLKYFKTDVYGKIEAESYREVCGVLADIPEIKERLDRLERCLKTEKQFENEDLFYENCKEFDVIVEMHNLLKGVQLCIAGPLHIYWDSPEEWAKACPFYQNQLCTKADVEEQMLMVDGDKEVLKRACDVEEHAMHGYENAIKPIAHCFVTFRGDAFCGGGLSWVALAIRKDDIKAVDFSIFLAALAGVGGDAADAMAYGGKVTFFPGPQDIIGIFIGYEGVSSGIFEEEYAGQPDPDRQDHAILGGLTLEKLWTISDDDGKVIKGGFSCSAGVGAGWQDDNSGSGWNGVFAGDCGAEFSFQW